jgi:hypothetical protein
MSGGGFYLDLRIRKDGYAWAAWRMVICLCRMRLLGDDGAIDGVERRDIDEGRKERWR